ncbi:MAG TPA: DUF6600 domain-containing protein [bacterium]|nr:DUF6600 domain-containing protein [bacterium]
MDGHRKSWMRFPVPWIAALATLVIVPAASADHDDEWNDARWYNTYEYSQWDDPGRTYDRWGSYDPYAYYHASSPHPEFDSLRGHGRWQRVPGFHEPLWFPYVAASWRPYYYGHWVNTHYGMTWVSYEAWGEIPHHYGHWVYVDHYGWGWVPGWEWGPAWVTWGVADGYIGWAPLPPAGYRYPRYHSYRPGHRHPDYRWSVSFGYDSSGLDFGLWVFLSDRDFCGTSVYTHAVPHRNTLSFFKEKRVLPVGRDLHVDYVRRVSPRPLQTVELTQRTTKTRDGRTMVMREPRGQESRIREGREATKSIVQKVDDRRVPEPVEKTRSGAVTDRSPVVTGKTRETARPEEVTGKSRTEAPSRSQEVTKSRGETPSRTEEVTKSRSDTPSRSEGVTKSRSDTPSRSDSSVRETSGKGQEKKEKRKR